MAGYGSETTTDEVLEGLDLSGRRIVITGTSSGLGEESTRALAASGAAITMAARDPEKNRAAPERGALRHSKLAFRGASGSGMASGPTPTAWARTARTRELGASRWLAPGAAGAAGEIGHPSLYRRVRAPATQDA